MGRVISDIRVFSEPGNRGAAPSYQNQFLELGFDYVLARHLVAQQKIGPRPNLLAYPWSIVCLFIIGTL